MYDVNGQFSSQLPVQSGVSEGSILGPVWFVLFINDMTANFAADSEICVYADDTKLYSDITIYLYKIRRRPSQITTRHGFINNLGQGQQNEIPP
jgi:hypothetical protein